MERNILVALLGVFCTIQSCSDENVLPDHQIQPLVSMAGKVYCLNNAPDTTKQKNKLPSNSYLPILLFLDNSSFIKINTTNCDGLGQDFICTKYYCGKYKLDDNALTLTFDSNMVIHCSKSTNNMNSKTSSSSSHVELKKAARSVEILKRYNYSQIPSFEPCAAQNYLMTLTSDTITNHIKYLIDEKIWENLFWTN